MTVIEVMYLDGCPGHQEAVAMATRLARTVDPPVSVHEVRVDDVEMAHWLSFLGSPSVRVDGVDIEPGFDADGEPRMACRIYTGTEIKNVPSEKWLRKALARAGHLTRR